MSRPMSRRAFTLVELVVVISMALLVVPVVWGMHASWDRQVALGHWQLAVADGLATAAEEVALDARRGPRIPGEVLAFQHGPCTIRYTVEEGVLRREPSPGCGPATGLATGLQDLRAVEGGVELDFVRVLDAGRQRRIAAFLPVEGP